MHSSITFFSSTPSPPIVYEFVIDEFLNVNIKKIYEVKSDDVLRYIGNDKIWANEKYVAFLLYDYRSLRQVIRIYYRGETNFGVGHSNIVLNEFSMDLSTMKFMEFNDNDMIYLRNIQKWKIYKLNDIEFIIDTYSNQSSIFPYLFNQYEIKLYCYHEFLYSRHLEEVILIFNITFTDHTDMNIYFIGNSKNETLEHSYGDQNFAVNLNKYYMGPNMILGYELVSSIPYGPNITLPKIVNIYDEKTVSIKLISNFHCSYVLPSRLFSSFNPYAILSLQWVYNNYIEGYVFSDRGGEVTLKQKKEYLSSYFIDCYTTNSLRYFKNKKILVVISQENNPENPNYIAHVFDIQEENIFWIDKYPINTNKLKLRSQRSVIHLDSTNWIILVSESEKDLLFVSENPKTNSYYLHSEVKIMYAYSVFGNQLCVSHYNETSVSIYKVYKYEDEQQKWTISIEFILKQEFPEVYSWFDIDVNGLGLIFTDPNTIYVYQVYTIFEMEFIRVINFFEYTKSFKFQTNNDEHDIVYSRKDSMLYIVMQNTTDTAERVLFIFELKAISHNSLKSIIHLDRNNFNGYVYLAIDSVDSKTEIFIYVYNQINYFQIIKFEKENYLRK